MSAADLAELAAEVLREWPHRWRYPELAAALARDGGLSAGSAAELVLLGLADPRTTEQLAGEYTAAGMFTAATEVIEQAELPSDAARGLRRQIETAQDATVTGAEERIFVLRDRANEVGVSFPVDEEALLASAIAVSDDADTSLRALERSIEAAERACATELGEQANAALAGFDGDGSAWLDAVVAAIDGRDYTAARALLASGPEIPPELRPAMVPRPRSAAAAHAFAMAGSLTELLTWYDPGEPAPVDGFDQLRPANEDLAANRLIATLHGLANSVNPHNALDFTIALHQLVGGETVDYSLRTGGEGGVLTWLRMPAPRAIPNAPLTGSAGIALWVAGTGNPPPEDPRPLIWFVPEVRVAEHTPWGIARLTATDLLLLLAPCPYADVADYRSINLLRTIAARLPTHDFLGQLRMAHTPVESELDWLLDLADVRPDPGCLRAVLRETAGHPELLRRVLTRLVDEPQRGEPRRQRLGHSALSRLRLSTEWQAEAREALQSPLRSDGDARAVLCVAVALYPDAATTFTVSQIERDLGGAITRDAVQQAADRLVADRLLESAGAHVFRLPDNRTSELLTSVGADAALDAAHEAIDELRTAPVAATHALADSVIRFLGHQIDGYLSGIAAEIDALLHAEPHELGQHATRASAYALAASNIYRKYREAVSEAGECDLRSLLMACAATTKDLSAGAVRIPEISGPADLRVHGNALLLRESFMVIFKNAWDEIAAAGRTFGTITVTIARVDASPPGVPDGMARSWALTVIEDSGRGIDPETRAGLMGGARQGILRRGEGVGLEMAKSWFESYRGHLEIEPETARLGGTCMRIWLPEYVAGPG